MKCRKNLYVVKNEISQRRNVAKAKRFKKLKVVNVVWNEMLEQN